MTAQTTATPEGVVATRRKRGPDKAPRKPRGAPMPENSEALHTGMHDMHEAERVTEVHSDDFPEMWKPPEAVEAPECLPGMAQRWIRVGVRGQLDADNQIKQAGQGWRPRPLSSVPQDQRHKYPAVKNPVFGTEVIQSGSLVLMHRPEKLSEQARAHYRAKRDGQLEQVLSRARSESGIPSSGARGFGAPQVVEHETKVLTRRPTVAAG